VIFGHGLGGDKDDTWGTTERLAELGVAVIGIDAPEHGSRSDPPTKDGKSNLIQSVTAFFAADPDTKAFDLEKVRDNFRQMASDQLELVRFIQSLATLDLLPLGAPDGVPDLDTTKILYLGHSFGSVLGPTVGALAPEIRAACWNVGGDGLTTLIRDSGLFSVFIEAFRPPGTPQSDVAKLFAITQAIIDPGDPANYARFATLEPLPGVPSWRAKDVLVQEVKEDRIVPNSSTEILARALGLAQVGTVTHEVPSMTRIAAPVTANLPSGATGGLVQFATANGTYAQHGDLIFSPEARKQYVEFFRTALAGRATIVAVP
jgi:pimeloyl-ACP methyl ester carboxylesterase